MVNALLKAQALGQSTWYDNISRGLLTTGKLGELIKLGVTGVTSNPTIFEKAITGSTDYDDALRELTRTGCDAATIFDTIAVEDIQGAADLLRSVYDHTAGADGYVSLEVSPHLAHDTHGTITAARYLFGALNRPNVMVKIPATPEGIPAVRTLIADGININVTLIFSLDTYRQVMDAYLTGLEDLVAHDGSPSGVASVASFFVSRVDTAVDPLLQERIDGGNEALKPLLGTAAVANARKAYALFRQAFGGERFAALAAKGARCQRPLWASTSTKNPAYSDTLYVDDLIGPDTVNTMPPSTLDSVLDHGKPELRLEGTEAAADAALGGLSDAGIDMDQVTAKLLSDGVASFAASYDAVLESIETKCGKLVADHAV